MTAKDFAACTVAFQVYYVLPSAEYSYEGARKPSSCLLCQWALLKKHAATHVILHNTDNVKLARKSGDLTVSFMINAKVILQTDTLK